jgi:hypothetical protein
MESVVAEHRSAMLTMIGPVGTSLTVTAFAAEQRGHLLQLPGYGHRKSGDVKYEGVRPGTLPSAVNPGFVPVRQCQGNYARALLAMRALRARMRDEVA